MVQLYHIPNICFKKGTGMAEGPLAPPTGALKARRTPAKRRIKLSRSERAALERQKLAEAAAVLFLDLDTPRKYPEIAQELGLSVYQLRELVRTQEFNDAYNNLFPDVGHDPRYKAVRAELGEMLPLAVKTARELLESPRTPAATRWKIAERIMATSNVLEPVEQSERKEMVEYLQERGMNIQNLNITLPPEFLAYLPKKEIIDGELKDPAD